MPSEAKTTGWSHIVIGMSVTWSFFSGAMGLDLGLGTEGLEPSLAVEIDPTFARTILRNRPELRLVVEDVAKLNGRQLAAIAGTAEVDFMVGGPPCQSFCPGGKRAALSDPRGNLIFEYLRLIGEVRPKRFVLENVANLITAAIKHRPIAERPGKSWNLSSYSRQGQRRLFQDDGLLPLEPDEQSGSALQYLLETAVAELGYSVTFGILDSSEFGAPQKRLRFVMIGDRDENAPVLAGATHGLDGSPFTTVRDAIGDLEADPGPGSKYTDSVRKVFDLVPEGGNWRDLPPEVAREAMGEKSYAAGGGKTGFFRRLAWDSLSPTIVGRPNRKGSALCHPSASRPLSVSECARLQGFPDSWVFEGSMNAQYQQIGNAVPVALGQAIGRMLRSDAATAAPNSDDLMSAALATTRAAARNRKHKLAAPA